LAIDCSFGACRDYNESLGVLSGHRAERTDKVVRVELSQSLGERDQSLIDIGRTAQESWGGDELPDAGEHRRSIRPGAGVA
jgi:hypothetical protein